MLIIFEITRLINKILLFNLINALIRTLINIYILYYY